jgi:peroxygenase
MSKSSRDTSTAAGRGFMADPAIARAVGERMAALPANATPLQKHALFFDRNGDGELTLLDTYRGSRALGFGRLLSGALALTINGALGWVTSDPIRPTLRITVAHIDRGKHGSDTDIYDRRGQFVPEEFEDIFRRFDRDRDGALSLYELLLRARCERDLFDIVGQAISIGEFLLTYVIAAENGKLDREALLGVYDGSLFYAVEARQRIRGSRSLTRRLRDWFPGAPPVWFPSGLFFGIR